MIKAPISLQDLRRKLYAKPLEGRSRWKDDAVLQTGFYVKTLTFGPCFQVGCRKAVNGSVLTSPAVACGE